MKRLVSLLVGLTVSILTSSATLADPVNTGPFGGVAIKGYDTVAYFTEGRAMKGSEDFIHEWLGTPWQFANENHRQLFAENPVKYAPQYGGFCTLGIAIDGHAAENIDPVNSWRVIEGKLYFVYDPTYVEVLDGEYGDDLIAQAETNWPDAKLKIKPQSLN